MWRKCDNRSLRLAEYLQPTKASHHMPKVSYKAPAATWGNGEVMVELGVSKDQWDHIARGDRVEFKGRGYWYEGDWFQDIWDFNCPHGEWIIWYGQPNDGDFSGQGYNGPISSVVVEGR